MTLSQDSPPTTLAGSIVAGARQFNWRRLAYLLAMAGAAGASIALLLLASSSVYAAVPGGLAVPAMASEPASLFEELRDNFLMWSLLLGSVVLMGLVLPFLLSGLFAIGTRLALYALAASLVVTGALLIAGTWLAAYLSSGAVSVTTRRKSPRLSRVEAEMRHALEVLMGLGITR